MGQKIVITANMKPERKAQRQVIYQWHWRRIMVAAGLVAASVTGVGYAVSGQIAEDNEAAETVAQQPEPVVAAKQQTISLPEVTEQNTAPSEDAVVLAPQSLPENETPEVAMVATEETVLEEVAPQPTPTEPKKAKQTAEFAESATVANLAIGAKIDLAKVSRSVLTTNVVEREPVDALNVEIPRHTFHDKLYFFTEINGLQGQSVRHLWYYQDALMAEVKLGVHTPRYRTFSSKNIMLNQSGLWRVEVRDEQNHLLATKEFRIVRRN